MGCQGWMSKQETPFSCHCAQAVEGCALSSENFSDFLISAPCGQQVQSGVARRQDESSFFLPALAMAVYTIPMRRPPPSSFLQDLCSPAVGGLCCSRLTVSSRSKDCSPGTDWRTISHDQQTFGSVLNQLQI